MSLFGAINSLGIAILGEYAARIYDQVRSRPNYIVARRSARSESESDFSDKLHPEQQAMLLWLTEQWGKEQAKKVNRPLSTAIDKQS